MSTIEDNSRDDGSLEEESQGSPTRAAATTQTRSSSSTTEEQQEEEQQSSYPPARLHSYLPGLPLPVEASRSLQGGIDGAGSAGVVLDNNTLAVLSLPDVVLFPGDILPLRLPKTDEWNNYILQQQQQQQQKRPCQQSLELGILSDRHDETATSRYPRRPSGGVRRRLFRRAMGPRQLRRFSDLIIRELQQELLEQDDNDDDDDEDDDAARRRRTSAPVWSTLAESEQAPTNSSQVPSMEESNDDNDVAENETVSSHHRVEVEDDDDDNNRTHPLHRWIGTVVALEHHHEDENNDRDWLFTTRATGRFAVDISSEAMHQRYCRLLQRHRHLGYTTTGCPLVILPVRRLRSTNVSWPTSIGRRRVPTRASVQSSRNLSHHLARVTPHSFHMYQRYLPWRWMDAIQEHFPHATVALDEKHNPVYTDCHHEESLATRSFRLANDLPLSLTMRHQLLHCPTVSERLQTIFQWLQQQQQEEKSLQFWHCADCQARLARLDQRFVVAGADSTTGTYVNPHRVVQQVVTVRELVVRNQSEEGCVGVVVYSGAAETKDSWFPGYSWTVMCCAVCGNHLGWKFDSVVVRSRGSISSKDRPDHFFGLTAASIVTS